MIPIKKNLPFFLFITIYHPPQLLDLSPGLFFTSCTGKLVFALLVEENYFTLMKLKDNQEDIRYFASYKCSVLVIISPYMDAPEVNKLTWWK